MSFAGSLKRRVKFFFKRRYSVNELLAQKASIHPLRLHLGCGQVYLKDWVNIDVTDKSLADVVMDFKDIKHNFEPGSVNEVLMVHSISYLRLWEARDFFAEVHSLLQSGGQLTLEFPDVLKCAKAMTTADKNAEPYLEALRSFYAFDMDEIKNKRSYVPYAFGWSDWHIAKELKEIGFSDIRIKDPLTHGQRLWRDTRIEAIK